MLDGQQVVLDQEITQKSRGPFLLILFNFNPSIDK